MNKLMVIAVLSIFSFNSFADFSLSCPEIYQKTMLAKEAKKRKAGRIGNQLGQGSFFVALAAPAVGVAMLVPTIGLSVYSNSASKEERVLNILEEGNRHLVKLTKKLRKNVNTDISADEVLKIVTDGLESGLFCQDFPHIYSPSEVKDHVEDVLKEKYASHQ